MDEIESQINKMTKEELENFFLTTQIINFTCNVSGIGSVVLMLMLPNLLTVACTVLTLYFMGNLAVGSDKTRVQIIKALKNKE